MLNERTLEIIEETGKIRTQDIEDIATFQKELEEAGYSSYLDPSTDHLIIVKKTEQKYRGIVTDDLGTMETRKTKYYGTYKEAHDAAEKLCKRTMGDRGSIDVEQK
jgi:hypothetical protein